MDTRIITDLNEESLSTLGTMIRAGALVAFPTETVYGLGANALDPEAAKKIYAAKGRPSDNPLIIHLAEVADAALYCEVPPLYKKLADAFLPGPLTVIMKKKPIVPDEVTAGLDTVAVRVPSHPMARALIRAAGVPVAAPSANLSGRPSTTCAAHVIADLYGRIDAIVDGGESEIGLESTIIRLDGERVTVLRPGGITKEMLCDLCGEENVSLGASVTEQFIGSDVPMAPGMKYKHYAPRSQVVLLEGEDDAFVSFTAKKKGCGVLCYDGQAERIRAARPAEDEAIIKTFGRQERREEQAHGLFAMLRAFDDEDFTGTVYAPMPEKDGIGLAVFNRLIKAAGFHVVKL